MSRVRHAGHLRKTEDNSYKKYWCVIRERSFIVYPCNETSIEYPIDVDNIPAYIFPISHLSATAYVLPAGNKRTPTQYALELDCAKSARKFTFYADHAVSLEKWVDAIKAESSCDNVTPEDSPHGALLPPELEFGSLSNPASGNIYRSTTHHMDRESLSMRYLEQLRNTGLNLDDYQKSESTNEAPSNHIASSPLLIRKDPTSMGNRPLPDVIPAYPAHNDDVNDAITPLSSPAFSSPSSSHNRTYQDSADESSVSSSTTSSPPMTKPRKILKSSFVRQQAVAPAKRKTRRNHSARDHRRGKTSENTRLQDGRAQQNTLDESTSNTSCAEEDGRRSNPYFYTGGIAGLRNVKSTPGMRHVKKASTPKRHTVGDLTHSDSAKLKNLIQQKQKFRRSQETLEHPSKSRHTRHSIAPLSSLDLQLSQRRRNTRMNSQVHTVTHEIRRSADLTVQSDDSGESSAEENSLPGSLQIHTRQISAHLDERFNGRLVHEHQRTSIPSGDHGLSDTSNIPAHQGMKKRPDNDLGEKVTSPNTSTSPTNQLSPRSFLDKPALVDSRARSGSFGSRFLHRVSSAVGKRNKSIDESQATSPPVDKQAFGTDSFTQNQPMELGPDRIEDRIGQKSPPPDQHLSSDAPAASVMEGCLYKRKRMKWNRVWAVLAADKTLCFYKNEQNVGKTSPTSIIELREGCEIENVVQAKNSNAFVLTPKLPLSLDLTSYSNSLDDSTSSTTHATPGKPIQLMCKSTQEFVHWIKSFVLLNTTPSPRIPTRLSQPIRTLSRIKTTATSNEQISKYNELMILKSSDIGIYESELNNNANNGGSEVTRNNVENATHRPAYPNLIHKPYRHQAMCEEGVTPVNVGIHKSFSFTANDVSSSSGKFGNSKENGSKAGPKIALSECDDIRSSDPSTWEIGRNSMQDLESSMSLDIPDMKYIDDDAASVKSSESNMRAASDVSNERKSDSSRTGVAFQSIETDHNKSMNDNRETTYGSNHRGIVMDDSVRTDVGGYKVITTSHSDGEKHLLTDAGSNNTNKFDSSSPPAFTDVTGSSNTPILNAASQVDQQNNGCVQEQYEGVDIKRSVGLEANKRMSRDGLSEACRFDKARSNCVDNRPSENGAKATEKLISGGASERVARPSAQTTPHRGRSSGDKGTFSLSSPSSLQPVIQKPGGNDSSIVIDSDVSSGKTCLSAGDEQKSVNRNRPPSVIDRIKLFERLSLLPDDCNEYINVSSQTEVELTADSPTSTKGIALLESKPELEIEDSNISLESDLEITIEQTDLSTIADLTLPLSEIICNKSSEEEENQLPPPSRTRLLRRSNSDSNILEPIDGESYRMRTFKKSVPELTKIDFIEIYGLSGKQNVNTFGHYKTLDNRHSNMDGIIFEKRRHSIDSDDSSSQKDFIDGSSSSSLESGSKIVESRNAVHRVPSRKSTGSGNSEGSSKDENRNSWFSNIAPNLRRSFQKSPDDVKTKASKAQVLQIPASQLSSASHRGYLDRRNKKKQWDRFWCVFQDSCLYCYNSPQSDVTRDAVLLRGYDIIADVTNMNRTRFVFRLEQQSAPTLHFSTDNHQEFLLWVGTLEKETRSMPANHSNDVPQRRISKQFSAVSRQSVESIDERSNLTRSLSQERLEQELIEMQKHKLLKEIASQQQQIIEEQRMLDRKESVELTSPVDISPSSRRASRRDDVIEKYDRAREEEETKMTKFMALLNRRRNSAQLKVDQLAKEIAPKSGKKRRQNHQHFAALEARLNEMKEKLSHIDGEIHELQANKQSTLEKIRERQDLELLVTEQQESLAILRRHENDGTATAPVRRRHRTSRSREALTSIDELSSISDCCSSGSSASLEGHPPALHAMSTPRYKRSSPPVVFEQNSSESIQSDDLDYLRSSTRLSQSQSASSLDDVIASSSLASSMSSLAVSKDSLVATKPSEKKTTLDQQIDPSVIAGIEEFEAFSRMTLDKLQRK